MNQTQISGCVGGCGTQAVTCCHTMLLHPLVQLHGLDCMDTCVGWLASAHKGASSQERTMVRQKSSRKLVRGLICIHAGVVVPLWCRQYGDTVVTSVRLLARSRPPHGLLRASRRRVSGDWWHSASVGAKTARTLARCSGRRCAGFPVKFFSHELIGAAMHARLTASAAGGCSRHTPRTAGSSARVFSAERNFGFRLLRPAAVRP